MSSTETRRPAAPTVAESGTPPAGRRASTRSSPPRALTLPGTIVAIVGLLVTAALALVSWRQYNSTENRLLDLRAREVGSLLAASIPGVETPLANASQIATATNADGARLTGLIAPDVKGGRPFVTVSAWRLGAGAPAELAHVGTAAALDTASPRFVALLTSASHHPGLNVTGLLDQRVPRIGYAFAAPADPRLVFYAEANTPANRRLRIESNSAFSDLRYALYLGHGTAPNTLIATDISPLPPTGRHSTVYTPFGTSVLTTLITAAGPFGGSLSRRLPWIIVAGGILFTLGLALLTARLVRRREHAERLASELDEIAGENRRLYARQRGIAESLQHALLPEALPSVEGVELAVRYVPGVEGMDIGGDWYDVIVGNEGRLLVVVGDVSGRGLRAATVMASLRHAIRAYAVQGDGPAAILAKLAILASAGVDGFFATVLCAELDVAGGQITLANAGHPEPLLVGPEGATFLTTEVGLPVGVANDATYRESTSALPSEGTLLAFTDGLVERREESLEVGSERLRAAAARGDEELEAMLDRILIELATGTTHDDVALLGLRWANQGRAS